MATRKIKVDGLNHDEATTAIVTWDDVEVFNGAITSAVAPVYNGSNDPGDAAILFGFDYNNADDTAETNHTVSIQITAGSLSIANFLVSCSNTRVATYPTDSEGDYVQGANGIPVVKQIDSDYYYLPGNNTSNYGNGETDHGERINVTINGSAPVLSGSTEPDNGASDPRWNAWQFFLESGDTWSATIRVPKELEAYVAL